MVSTYHINTSYEYLHCIESVSAACGYPLFGNEDSKLQITGYSNPGIEGRNVSIRCPPGMVPVGPSTLVCTGNGEWEPDPRKVACVYPATTAMLDHTGIVAIVIFY